MIKPPIISGMTKHLISKCTKNLQKSLINVIPEKSRNIHTSHGLSENQCIESTKDTKCDENVKETKSTQENIKTIGKNLSTAIKNLNESNTFLVQLGVGTVAGIFAGHTLRYSGRFPSVVLGFGTIIYHVALQKGLVPPEMEQQTSDLRKKGQEAWTPIKEQFKNKKSLTAGFIGGFLIGIAI